MIRYKRGWTQIIGGAAALAMLTVTCLPSLGIRTEAASSQGMSYKGETNAMKPEEYAEFGLVNSSPAEFDPEDSSNPMEGYEPTILSELYVGQMNRHDHWKGSYMVLNNTAEISKNAFNLDTMANDKIGTEKSFNDFYAANKNDKEVQTHNACAIDYDGDGTDEILDVTLYVDKTYNSDPKQRSCADVRLYDWTGGDWKMTGYLKYVLADGKSDAATYVWSIEADASKGLAVVAAGDYDGDGKEEGAVYIPSQIDNKAYIAIVKKSDGDHISQIAKVGVDELNGPENTFNFRYKSWKMPIVNLATTKISGGDDLVINISHPLKSNDDYGKQGQNASIGIFHYDGGKMQKRYADPMLESGGSRMRFCSAVDADLNGNGVSELVVGGYKNKDWSKTSDVGNLDSGKNLVQLICWNKDKKTYEKVWDSPKEVDAHGGLRTSLEMTEPAALTAGRLSGDAADQLFLEGVIFRYVGAATEGGAERSLHQNGSFSKTHSIAMSGSHNAFISTAHAAKFSSAGKGGAEQIVVLLGDHENANDDNIYYDICWVWHNGAEVTSAVTNDNYIHRKNEDDDGTFISLCPLDADDDAVYMDYRKKTYGWSAPVLHSILQSPPYWSELTYNGETFGAGKASYKITYGSGSGTDGDWGVGLGLQMELSFVAGGGILGNNAMMGFNYEIGAMGKYIGSYGKSNSISDSYEIAVPPGEDQAIVMAVPVVAYHYDLWIPEYTVTQENINDYNKLRDSASNPQDYPEEYTVYTLNKETGEVDKGRTYKVGDTVPGHWEDSKVVSTLTPSFARLPLEKYNELAKKHSKDTGLKEVTDGFFNDKKIGDPSSYPHSEHELYEPENRKNLHLSKQTASVTVGEGEHTLSYEVENETEESHGFNLELEGVAGLKVEAEVSFIVGMEGEFSIGGKAVGEGGASWITTNSEGVEYAASVIDLAAGTPDDYKFNAQMAVFDAADLPRGSGESDSTSIVGYIVTGIDGESAPPRLPVDLRVYGTTKTEAALKWETTKGDRHAQSYEVYVKDNLGNARIIGRTDKDFFVAEGLTPHSTYQFAVKSYSGPLSGDGAGNIGRASCLSRWVTANTKSGSSKAPKFTEQPKNVLLTAGEAESGGGPAVLRAKAEAGEEGAALTYQWQKYNKTILTQEGTWEDVGEGELGEDGSTVYLLPEINEENKGQFPAYYRVVATQTKGSVAESVISRLANVYVGDEFSQFSMDLSMVPDDGIFEMKATDEYPLTYYMNYGENKARFQVKLQPEEGGTLPDGGEIQLMHYEGNVLKQFEHGHGSIENDEVVIELSGDVGIGVYRIFAVYSGNGNSSREAEVIQETEVSEEAEAIQETGARADDVHYLAAMSNPIEVQVVAKYNMEYHLNGGGQNMPYQDVYLYQGEKIRVMQSDPIKQGYTLEGWYTDRNFTRKVPEDTVEKNSRYLTLDPPKDDKDENGNTDDTIDLYARWTPIEYQIRYDLKGGGNNSPLNPSTYTIETPTTVLEPAERSGYIFKGWYSDPELTQQVSLVAGGSMGDVILYAKWEEDSTVFPQEEDGSYRIADYKDLVLMAQKIQDNPEKYASAVYVQTQNINCNGQAWELPIGTTEHPFTGTYQGNDYYVLGLRQGSAQIGGLFGVIGQAGKVSNLSVIDLDYNEWTDIAGGIAGINQGIIDGCGSGVNIHSAATIFRDGKPVPITTLNSEIKGMSAAGGIAGRNEGTILNSHSNAVVSAKNAGGAAGDNSGNIYNVYNTGDVKGQELAGGIAGKNAGTGKLWYGYSSGAATAADGGVVGGIAGSSGNGDIGNLWYPADMSQACGDKPDSALTAAGKKTQEEMSDEAFCRILNAAMAGQKETLGLRNWEWSASKNEGLPTLEYVAVVQQTLSVSKGGVQIDVTGMIHPGASIKLVRLSEDYADYQSFTEALESGKSGKWKDSWRLALLYEDGTYGTWNGQLTVSIKAGAQEAFKNLRIFHKDAQGTYQELTPENGAEGLTFVTDSPDNLSLAWKGGDGSGEEENPKQPNAGGDKKQLNTGSDKKQSNTGGDKKQPENGNKKKNTARTGDASRPLMAFLAMLASGTVIFLVGRRRYRQKKL